MEKLKPTRTQRTHKKKMIRYQTAQHCCCTAVCFCDSLCRVSLNDEEHLSSNHTKHSHLAKAAQNLTGEDDHSASERRCTCWRITGGRTIRKWTQNKQHGKNRNGFGGLGSVKATAGYNHSCQVSLNDEGSQALLLEGFCVICSQSGLRLRGRTIHVCTGVKQEGANEEIVKNDI